MNHCINLTQRMTQCKRPPATINVHRNGTTSAHCRQHWAEFYGHSPAMPTGIVAAVKYTDERARLLDKLPAAQRIEMATLMADNDFRNWMRKAGR